MKIDKAQDEMIGSKEQISKSFTLIQSFIQSPIFSESLQTVHIERE